MLSCVPLPAKAHPFSGLGAEASSQPAQTDISAALASAGKGIDLSSALQSVGRDYVQRGVKQVVFRSQISPAMAYDPKSGRPAEAGAGSPGGAFGQTLMRVVKPAVYVETSAGTFKYAPYGEPTANYFYPVVIGAAALGGVLLYLIYKGIRA